MWVTRLPRLSLLIRKLIGGAGDLPRGGGVWRGGTGHRTAKAESFANSPLASETAGGGEARGHRGAPGSAHSAPHGQQRGALPGPSPPWRGWVHPAGLLSPTLLSTPHPLPRRLSGCKERFIGLCENVKIKTSLSGIKYTSEIKFRDLFAQFLVDKLRITPKGKNSLA